MQPRPHATERARPRAASTLEECTRPEGVVGEVRISCPGGWTWGDTGENGGGCSTRVDSKSNQGLFVCKKKTIDQCIPFKRRLTLCSAVYQLRGEASSSTLYACRVL